MGAEVKQDQLLLSIGDLSGFTMTFPVSEININRLKLGLKAIVTGDAFPGITLEGVVTSVTWETNHGQTGGQGALSMFNIEIKISNVSEKEREVIHVGMTANVEIDVKNRAHILLAIQAVFQKKWPKLSYYFGS